MAQKKKAAAKLDLAKVYPQYYKAGKEPVLIRLDPIRYLTVEGAGAPEGEQFHAAVGALYGVAFTVKMTKKFAGTDYKVSHLEGLWWADWDRSKLADPEALWTVPRESWKWKLMIMVPEFITKRDFDAARRQLIERRGDAAVDGVKLETLDEGMAVQILHVGPYAAEPESIGKMRALMKAEGLRERGLHHEIYLSDPRRVAPERLRTILRQPVEKT